jgi:hypothetical protein
MANKKLSELAERVNLPTNALIHILDPNDLSQSPQGSDFKFDSTKLVETATSLQAKRPLKTIEGQSLEGFGNVVLPNNNAIQLLSTGLNQGGLLTINTDAAKFDLSAGFGYVVNGHSDPDNTTQTKVTWTAKIANVIPNIATQNQTYVAVDINGDLFLTNVPLTATQRRNYIRIGVLIHLDNSAVTYIDNQPTVNIEIGGQVQDILEALGFRSLSGNRVFPVSNNLKIKKELGRVFKSGANFDNLTTQPHSFTLAAQEPITFRYRTQTGAEGAEITDITPAIYDLNGTITPVAATATLATIQRVYIFQDGVIRIQPGQRVFTTLNAAITALNSDLFVTDLDIAENGLYLGAIVLTRNTVDLSNISQAIFAPSIGTTANGSVASPALGYTAEDVANKQNSLTVDGTGSKYTTVDAVNAGLSGKASLDGGGKVPLSQINDALLGSVNYKGTYNASTNLPALPSATTNKGNYYVVTNNGTQFAINFVAGDWIISNGSNYEKVDNNNNVTSVAGRVGAVTLVKGDVGLSNVDNTTDLLKPISTATQNALDLKISGTGTTGNIPVFTSSGVLGNSDLLQINPTSLNYGSDFNSNIRTLEVRANTDAILQLRNANNFYGMSVSSTGAFVYRNGANNAVVLKLEPSANPNALTVTGVGANNRVALVTNNQGEVVIGSNSSNGVDKLQVNGSIQTNSLIKSGQFTTATEPAYFKGSQFFNTTLNKMRIGGATAYESIATNLDLNLKEDVANKQNSLAVDGTGSKYTTVDAVKAGLDLKYDSSNPSGFTANATNAQLRDRATHTGVQTASTISDIQSTITNNTAVSANTAKTTNATHTGDATGSTALTLATVNANVGTFNNVTVNGKGLVTGASNVVYATGSGSATGTNTGDNATNTQYSGLSTSKENTITAGTTSQYYRGDKTFQTLDKAAVALANADNTSDANKPISTATQTALNAKISGTGTTNFLPKFTASGTVGNSGITELSNSNVGINQPNPIEKLDVVGNGKFSGTVNGAFGNFQGDSGANIDTRVIIGGTGNGGTGRGTSILINGPGSNSSEALVKLDSFTMAGPVTAQTGELSIKTANAGVLAERIRITSAGLSVTGDINATGKVTASPATLSTELATLGQVNAASSRPYKVYTALLNQSGTNAPVATVLENTLGGTVVWSRNNNGSYLGTLNLAFTENKTTILATGGSVFALISGGSNTVNNFSLVVNNSAGSNSDGILSNATIEIRVYN